MNGLYKKTLKYRVLVEKETADKGTNIYVTQVPTLGISDYGNTIEEALENTKKLIKFHIECLLEEGEPIPEPDNSDELVIASPSIEFETSRELVFA
ncbi:MAG: type II toxin-antitoxin system HicB family antitoxin [bacterium]